ncbi:DNA polymerase family X [uncultured virus]|nr:DNA polymerase family X [uncultured virus]
MNKIKKKTEDKNEQYNPKNEKIIKEFEKLIDQIKYDIDHAPTKNESMTNYYRLRQITKSIEIIKKYPKEIRSGEELKDIKGIGKGTISRINEILSSGSLSEIKVDSKIKKYLNYIEDLTKVYGIGPKTAYELITLYNIKNVDELKKAFNEGTIDLTNQIIIGLKYYGIYKEIIPRQEIDKIDNYLNKIVLNVDKELFHVICGSYRRKKLTSNDIDVLITHPKIKTRLQLQTDKKNYLVNLVKKLKKEKFLLDDLTDKDFEIKYMGFCQYKENKIKYPVRRIDIRYIPYDSYYTALVYFTGSGEFNRKMRQLAQNLGYKLNEYGLYFTQGNKLKRIKINSEKDIFDALGLEYLSPDKRNG